ncbi:MAG: hypothetical protein KDC18_05665 [Alphaproteobacteria bacterium]|nr:hypothetical protein [Alphaproteobacteria bacterium]
MRLQLFGHRESRYERPTLDWCCGGVEQCALGPDADGGCRAGPMCQPVKVGDLYKCARSPVAGGPCAAGPGPSGQCGCMVPTCVPRPTLRARRSRIARWATLLAVAVVLIAVSLGARERWLAGPLTAGHAEIGECTACHQGAGDSPSVWLHQAFLPDDPVAASKSCLGCHDRGGEALAFSPHNQPPDVLRAWGEQGGAAKPDAGGTPLAFTLASAVFGPAAKDEPLACATCHQEHRGGAEFTAMSDSACQSCHQRKFDSFPEGHPAFGGFPYRERQHIVFNHASHIDLHFPKSDPALRPENCTSCHVADGNGAGMLLTGYGSTCASCHDADIRKGPAAGPPGKPFLAVPGLDLATLVEKGVPVGFWPDSFYDRGVPPVMRALLSVGYMDEAQLDKLQGVDLLDLTQAGPEVLEAVKAFAWATKAMLADMLQNGVLGNAKGMQDVFGVHLGPTAMSRLGGSVPRDVLAMAADAWFGCSLYSELAAYRDGHPPATVPLDEHVDGKPPACAAGGDKTAAAEASGHQPDASEPAAAGSDIAPSALDALTGGDQAASPFGGGILGGGDQPAPSDGGSILGGGDQPAPADGGGILGGAPLGGAAEGNADSILGGIAQEAQGGSGADAAASDQAPDQASSQPAMIQPEPVDPAEWARYGGWYRTAEAVYYRPVEHADGFLRAWLDFAGAAHGSPAGKPLANAIFETMGQPTSVGRCVKCHAADQQADGSVRLDWQARMMKMAEKTVTTFRHAPHLTIGGQEACNTCHKVTPGDAVLASFKSFDAGTFTPGFQAMTKETCATCHSGPEAGGECQHCHNYHVGMFSRTHPMGRLTTAGTVESSGTDAKPATKAE